MADVMLTFGTVRFSVIEAAYQRLRRATSYRLPVEARVGAPLGYQYTGPAEDSITLAGVIMPTYRGRPAVLDDLRALALEGRSQVLSAGTGEQFGRWVLADVTDERSRLFKDGAARKVAFTVRLLHDDEAPQGELTQLDRTSAANGNVRAVTDEVAAAVARGDTSAEVVAAAQGAA